MSFSYLCLEPLLTGLEENSPFLQRSPEPCWVQPLLPTIPLGRAVPGTGALPFTCVPGPLPSVTFPLDLTKTRLQIQGEAAVQRNGAAAGQAVPYRGMLRTAAGIAHEEGLWMLWQGATPAVYRHIGEHLFLMGHEESCLLWPSLLE